MVTTYIPKKSFFEPTRIQKIAKDILKDCDEDRCLALSAYDNFRGMAENGDAEVLADLAKFLKLSQEASANKIKILDSMLKITQTEIRATPTKEKEKTDFAKLRKGSTKT